jgi:general secretion pathway protein D
MISIEAKKRSNSARTHIALMVSALALVCAPAIVRAQEGAPEEEKKPEEEAQPQKQPIRKTNPMQGRGLQPSGTKMPTIAPEKRFQFPADPAIKQPPVQPQRQPVGDDGTTTVSPGDNTPGIADLKIAKGQRCKPMRPDAKVMFDFKGDILELVSAISKTTCKNFILTNKVRSQKFEIISPTSITVDEAWRAFLSALEANEFTIIQVGKYYKIIQAVDATRSPTPIYSDGQEIPINDRMVTKIYRLKHASDVNSVVNYLNIFKSNKGQMHPYVPTNTLIATDFGTSLERVEKILAEIDQPGALEQLHVVPVEFANAQEIAEKLTQVFEPQKAAAATGKANASSRLKVRPTEGSPQGEVTPAPDGGGNEEEIVSVSKILADERTNKLIIIASERSFKQIMSLKKELDVPDDGSDSQIQVLRLKHADAEELASTLASLSQGKPTTARAARTSVGKQAASKQPVAQQPASASGASATLFQGEVKVTADKPTNSLLITASKGDFISLRRVIDRLDIARYQVFVEAVIMEVSVKRDRQLGFTWHGGFSPLIDGRESPIIFGNQPTSNFSSLQASLNPLSLASVLGFAGVVRGPTLPGSESLISGGIPSIGVVIQALQTTNDVNVVSTPHILTLDNEEAEIQVNEKRPFPSGLSLGGLGNLGALAGQAGGAAAGALGNLGGLGLGSLSFNREDVGLTLKLKPQISDEEYVRLEIDQELSDVAGLDAATNQTVTSKRAAKTVVVVRNQDSVVIGGLVRDRESIDESKVPLFGDLPLIGWLFKRQVKIAEKVNLLLVLTPYIIRGPQDFQTIFERKMKERKEFVDRFHGTSYHYDAEIDWGRKRGPLASYRLGIRRELTKAENEGPGTDDQTIIKPDDVEDGGTIGPVDTPRVGGETPVIVQPEPGEPVGEPPPDSPDDL